ncbi:MAG: glycerol-3-phosphate dehydrogenase [Candidatus Omnitrophica bacterium CG11_big_fil_rev_8_21_14_0_20_45_26]|uniref:Glycerol-3-phosphate dehydrogenase [NAD(P)+] n=1 Tax=Candidatus Abzuiibacterium crystallinum TaxID=1974748 RepID=A0A2H0LNS4_9BACT|nr:MAG: glycerol-3-phosphate dehydrogenase [Candidatus Omnitrophica bacterium CG11_big_fil_rev_8_21_14_0_20_45_26]PIW63801.1 MAG: glycerol-3-phosphate dehydrogenase [Candidatus Omnitrophica bacterium CG12_big_fil_rev_8_21_14_0_65_45_16]
MAKFNRVSVLGDGGWGTGLALVSLRAGHKTILWSAFPEYAVILREKRENKKYLPGIPLPEELVITSDIKEAVDSGDLVVLAVPTLYLRNVLFQLKGFDLSKKILVSVAKGIEKKTLLCPSQIITQVLGNVNLAVLSGPSHAEEVARNIPTLVVAASKDKLIAETVQKALRGPRFRIYVQHDVVGVELAGALKNVIAIAAGICDGLGFGANTKAALLARGIFEMTHLGVQMGANPNTFFGLSGIGDLITTCISEYGRNRRVGELLGKGLSLQQILKDMDQVAEGVETARSVHELRLKYHVETPIMEQIYQILHEGKRAIEAVESLMQREAKEELRPYNFSGA